MPLCRDLQLSVTAVKGERGLGAGIVTRLARDLGTFEHNSARAAVGEHIDDGDLHSALLSFFFVGQAR